MSDLPASLDAERAILGALLLDFEKYREEAEALCPADFSLDSHRRIFTRMLELNNARRSMDMIVLSEELGRHRELENVGGAVYLASLTDGLPRRPSIAQYVRIVKEKAVLRSTAKFAEKLQQDACAPGASQNTVLDQIAAFLPGITSPSLVGRRAEILTLADVQPREVPWLWRPYLPAGMLAMLSGDPGAGKTYIALAIAAALTTGKVPFSGEKCEPIDVLYLSVENDPACLVRPRFDTMGGDARRLHIVRGTITGEGDTAERDGIWLRHRVTIS